MKMLLFEGTPEEFAGVEHLFATGAPGSAAGSVLAFPKPQTWPELDEGQLYKVAKAAMGRMSEKARAALVTLAEADEFLLPWEWGERAGHTEEQIYGYTAEFSRCVGRAMTDVFGSASTPDSCKGGAYLLLERGKREGFLEVVRVRPPARQAMVDIGLLR